MYAHKSDSMRAFKVVCCPWVASGAVHVELGLGNSQAGGALGARMWGWASARQCRRDGVPAGHRGRGLVEEGRLPSPRCSPPPRCRAAGSTRWPARPSWDQLFLQLPGKRQSIGNRRLGGWARDGETHLQPCARSAPFRSYRAPAASPAGAGGKEGDSIAPKRSRRA